MKSCPKCHGGVPEGKQTCPHCGLVFQKWYASQQQSTAEPVESPIPVEPQGREKENLSFLIGWLGGVIPLIGIMVAAYNYMEGHKRKAFQALVATWWSLPIFVARIFTAYRPSPVNEMVTVLVPVITLLLVRKLDWPINTTSDEPEPRDLNAYFHRRRLAIGSVILLFVAIGVVGHLYPIDANVLFLLMLWPVVIYGGYAFVQVIKNFIKPVSLTKRLDNVLKLGASIIFVTMFVSVLAASERVTDEKMRAVITALDAYQAANGRYPDCRNPAPPVPSTGCGSLEILVPEYLVRVPSCQFGWMSYWTREDGSYSLTCHYFMFMKRAYDSREDRWYSYD